MTQAKADVDPMDACAEMMGEAVGKGGAAPCPMSSMCSAMMGKGGGVGLLALVPGILMVLVGVLVLVKPGVLVWLLGITSIVLGAFALAMAIYMRRWMVSLPSEERPSEPGP